MKAPLVFHSTVYQWHLLRTGSREQIIGWLVWSDPNGTYRDADSDAEEMPRLTLDRAREIMTEQIARQ